MNIYNIYIYDLKFLFLLSHDSLKQNFKTVATLSKTRSHDRSIDDYYKFTASIIPIFPLFDSFSNSPCKLSFLFLKFGFTALFVLFSALLLSCFFLQ